MKRNSKLNNVIHLADRQAYNDILNESITELSNIEIRLKEIALNLLAKSEYSDWSKGIQTGEIQEISDEIFENSSDSNVRGLFDLALKVYEIKKKVTEDNK